MKRRRSVYSNFQRRGRNAANRQAGTATPQPTCQRHSKAPLLHPRLKSHRKFLFRIPLVRLLPFRHKWVSWSSPHSRDLLWAFDSHLSGFLFPQKPGRSIAFIMLSLIWTVFFVHVAIYLVNTIGASTVDNLVRYCSLSFFLNPPDRPSIIVNTANLPTNRSYYFPSSSYGFST